MHRLTALLLLIGLALAGWQPALAQAGPAVIQASYKFGEEIVFEARLPGSVEGREARFFFKAPSIPPTSTAAIPVDSSGRIRQSQPLAGLPLRAFSQVEYWLEVTTPGGQVSETEHRSFTYEDNRFSWRIRQNGQFRLHWYQGDTQFAETVLDVAGLGLENIHNLLPLELKDPVEIYAYASAQDMRGALQISGQSWVGAHADPDLGVMVVSLPPGPEQRLEIERQVPHELMHILLYQYLGLGYANLPAWLNEGLGSVAELYPNPDYLIPLDRASQKDTLLPMASLCREFPRDMSGALLAYAQATSFTRFLHHQYGSAKMDALVNAYAGGQDCESAIQSVFESSLSQLERTWQSESLGRNPLGVAALRLGPWMTIGVVILLVPLVSLIVPMRRKANQHERTTTGR